MIDTSAPHPLNLSSSWGDNTRELFFGLEMLQPLLADTLYPTLTAKLTTSLLTFSSALHTFTVTLILLSLSLSLSISLPRLTARSYSGGYGRDDVFDSSTHGN